MSPQSELKIDRRYGGWAKNVFANSIAVSGPAKTVYLSGVGAEDADDGHIRHPGDFVGQARYSYQKLKDALAEHGATMANVVKMTTYVLDAAHRDQSTMCRKEAFGDDPLATHTFVVVDRLAWPDMLVEIDVTAVVPE